MDWQPAREKREIWVTISGATLAMLLATAIIVARVAALPLMPIDETRYLSVAWEMWQHHTFLVPTLNGEAYSHKPPLLFWLIQLGWWLFGTSDWVARLVIPTVGLSAFWLVADIVRQLDPDARREAWWSPLVLLGTTLWFLFLPLSMFDILLSVCLLAAVDGWRHVRPVASGPSSRCWG
jgi:4-amino-4-deoxy-L-arabinose transferase-like glycosyltransferase